MAPLPVSPSLSAPRPWQQALSRPWPILLAALVATGLALVLLQAHWLTTLGGILLAAGLVLAGAAVSRRLQTATWHLEQRIESAGVVAAAALVAFVAFLAAGDSARSVAMFCKVLAVVALVGSVFVLLPTALRHLLVSLLVVFHFSGILAATTAVAPANSHIPWLTAQAWPRVYGPYLEFIYMTNAYHFYSPDPGPPSLLWFRVEFEGGKVVWFKVADRKTSPIGLHYQRMLALAEYVNVPNMRLPFNEDEKRQFENMTGKELPHDTWERILHRHNLGYELTPGTDPIPLVPIDFLPLNVQYQEPQDSAKQLIASYARHVAHTVKDPDDPARPVRRVKFYRVTHNLLLPAELAAEQNPYNPVRYWPYYWGTYDPDGKLLDPTDPYLYWYLPISMVPRDYPRRGAFLQPTSASDSRLLNSLEIHAAHGDRDPNRSPSPFAEVP